MKLWKLTALVLGASMAMVTACKDNESTNSDDTNTSTVQSSIGMILKNTSASTKPGSRAVGDLTFSDGTTTFTITEARLNIRDIVLDTSNTTVAGSPYTIDGPYVMNLIDGTAAPANIVFDAPAGEYKRMDVRIDESNIEDGLLTDGDALLGNALIVKGTHDYNGVADGTFTLTVKVSEDIRFEPTNGIVVATDAGTDITLNLSVSDWLEDPLNAGTKIDLTSCVAAKNLMDSSDHIALNEGTQCEGITESIGNIIKENMKNKYEFSSN